MDAVRCLPCENLFRMSPNTTPRWLRLVAYLAFAFALICAVIWLGREMGFTILPQIDDVVTPAIAMAILALVISQLNKKA